MKASRLVLAAIGFISNRRPLFSCAAGHAGFLGGIILLCGLLNAGGQTATWTGGNSFQNYGTAGNWSPAVVPVNQVGLNSMSSG